MWENRLKLLGADVAWPGPVTTTLGSKSADGESVLQISLSVNWFSNK